MSLITLISFYHFFLGQKAPLSANPASTAPSSSPSPSINLSTRFLVYHLVTTIGFVISGLSLTGCIMDCPGGSAARMRTLERLKYRAFPTPFASSILKFVWKMCATMDGSTRLLQYTGDEENEDFELPDSLFKPCLPTS